MRKLFSLIALLACSTFVFGGEQAPSPYPSKLEAFPYIGANVGAAGFLNRESTSSPDEAHHLGALGFTGGGYFGYEFRTSRFDFSVEIFGNGELAEAKILHYENGSTLKERYIANYGIRVLPGCRITPSSTLYLLAGYVRGEFKILDNGAYGTIDKRYGSNGYQVGLGTKIDITRLFSIRLDTNYSGFASQTKNGLSTTGVSNHYTSRPSSLEGLISFVLNFK